MAINTNENFKWEDFKLNKEFSESEVPVIEDYKVEFFDEKSNELKNLISDKNFKLSELNANQLPKSLKQWIDDEYFDEILSSFKEKYNSIKNKNPEYKSMTDQYIALIILKQIYIWKEIVSRILHDTWHLLNNKFWKDWKRTEIIDSKTKSEIIAWKTKFSVWWTKWEILYPIKSTNTLNKDFLDLATFQVYEQLWFDAATKRIENDVVQWVKNTVINWKFDWQKSTTTDTWYYVWK